MSPSRSPRGQSGERDSSYAAAAELSSTRGEEVKSSQASKKETKAPLKSPQRETSNAPPLPEQTAPPLPLEEPPDDGWDPVWDDKAQAYYFYNRFTQQSQWTNPRVPEVSQPTAPGVGSHDRVSDRAPGTEETAPEQRPHGGYDPAIHGDYDPTAPYAQEQQTLDETDGQSADPTAIYTATGVFNRFTGKWQPHNINPENHNDENKSRRQMSAFFDVDAAANSHNGKSLKAERSGKKLSKQELKAFKEKRKERKEEKRRAWLRD